VACWSLPPEPRRRHNTGSAFLAKAVSIPKKLDRIGRDFLKISGVTCTTPPPSGRCAPGALLLHKPTFRRIATYSKPLAPEAAASDFPKSSEKQTFSKGNYEDSIDLYGQNG
jgi:hypothetical protein